MNDMELIPFKEWLRNLGKVFFEALHGIGEGVLLLLCALFVAAPAYAVAYLYVWLLQGRSNCLVWALWAKARNWKRKVVCVRNSRGRRHWQVIGVDGSRWEWYAKGASQRSRLANLWYRGEAKKVGSK